MRLSLVLFQQHTGRMFRNHWKVQGKKILRDKGALRSLESAGITYEDAIDIVAEPSPPSISPPDIVEEIVEPPKSVDTYTFGDGNVLVGGLAQAQVFTNAVMFPLNRSYSEEVSPLPTTQDKLIKRCIRSSVMYDAWQEKLPIRKDPERPAWNFPRDYGITDKRKNDLLCKRLLQFLSSSSPQLLTHRRILPDAKFRVPVNRDGKTVILDSTADILVTSTRGIEPMNEPSDDKDRTDVPNIAPLLQTVSIPLVETLETDLNFQSPLVDEMDKTHVHTAIVHFSPTQVTNLYETQVTEDQILGRSLMKAFAFAVAQAKISFGEDVTDLPQPVTVQCVQTDSREFHFCVFQLNTTKSYDETDVRNYVWSMPRVRLFEECGYIEGKPVLDGYNSSVIATLQGFYYSN